MIQYRINTDDDAFHFRLNYNQKQKAIKLTERERLLSAKQQSLSSQICSQNKHMIWKATFPERISLAISKTHFTMKEKYIKPVVQH